MDRGSNWLVGPFIEFEGLKVLEGRHMESEGKQNCERLVLEPITLTFSFTEQNSDKHNNPRCGMRRDKVSGLKRNKVNHHSLTRLMDLK